MSQTDKRLEQLGIELPKRTAAAKALLPSASAETCCLFPDTARPTKRLRRTLPFTPESSVRISPSNRGIRLHGCAGSTFWPPSVITWAIWIASSIW